MKALLVAAVLLGSPLAVPSTVAAECSCPAEIRECAGEAVGVPVGAAAAAEGEGTVSAEQIRALREELARIRRQAEEAEALRREQEARIKALEQALEALKGKAAAAPVAGEPVTVRPGFKARLYGFARADVDIDSRKMFAHPHLPFWALSPADPRGRNRTDGDFTIHPRLTRLGLDTEAPPVRRLGDAKFTGKIEVDFFNFVPGNAAATSNSRQFFRMRHAYGRLDYHRAYLLFGQTWDLISPLFPSANDDVLMWNAGNLGDRRPQIRVGWEPKVGRGKASLAVAALSADAVGGSNRDGDPFLDGEESRRPLVQARAAINQPSWVKNQNWELGVWGHNGRYRLDRMAAVAGTRSFTAMGGGIDLRLPITEKLTLLGEGWLGKGLADVRGNVGQDINLATGRVVSGKGGWAEAQYQFNDLYTLDAGFTIDDPDDSDVTPFSGDPTTTGRTRNRSLFVTNRFNLGSNLTLGVDWMFFKTDFRGLPSGSNNRWNIWLRHAF